MEYICLVGNGKPSLCASHHTWPINMRKVVTVGRSGRGIAFFKSSESSSCLDVGGCLLMTICRMLPLVP